MKIGFLLTSILLFAGTLRPCLAQFTLTGQSGNFLVPEARVIGDKKIAFGSSFHPQQEAFILYKRRQGTHEIYNFVTLGFLPFMEMTLNVTRIVKGSSDYGIGDRSASLRFLIRKETENLPSILIGVYVPLAVNGFIDSNFLTATKNFNLMGKPLSLSAGFGVPWELRTRLYDGFSSIKFLRKESDYQSGVFGSVRYGLTKYLLFSMEYDTHNFNTGIVTSLLKERCFIKLYTFNFRAVGFGVTYSGEVK